MTLPYPPSPGMGSPVPAMPTEPVWPTAVITVVPAPTGMSATHAPIDDRGGISDLAWVGLGIAALFITCAIAFFVSRAFYRRNP